MANPENLSTLTVSQLKAICKEKGIVGYSKLAKNALLQKLTEHSYPATENSSSGSSRPPFSPHEQASAKNSQDYKSLKPDKKADESPIPNSVYSGRRMNQRDDEINSDQTSSNASKKTLSFQTLASSPSSSNQLLSSAPYVSVQDKCCDTNVGINNASLTGKPSKSQSPLAPSPLPMLTPDVGKSLHDSAGFHQALSDSSLDGSRKRKRNAEMTSKRQKVQIQHSHRLSALPANNAKIPKNTELPGDAASKAINIQKTKLTSFFKIPTVPIRSRLEISAAAAPPMAPCLPPIANPISTSSLTVHHNPPLSKHQFIGKRFKPLLISKKPVTSLPPEPIISSASLYYLEPPVPPPVPELPIISLPPKILQRRSVHRWAIILSQIGPQERQACVLVSRQLRYAVYLSASYLLNREFFGQRYDCIERSHPVSMTNLWPYMRYRLLERSERRKLFQSSFLPRLLGSLDPLSMRMWSSPDNERQCAIALRFILTRIWFLLSLPRANCNSHPLSWAFGVVLDAHQVVREIWQVTVLEKSCGLVSSYYVLEATCEVIGHPSIRDIRMAPDEHNGNGEIANLRVDWSSFVEQKLRQMAALGLPVSSGIHAGILEYMSWTGEDHKHGISKLWLDRISGDQEEGTAKRTVAYRYILASLVANSVSGERMSSAQMSHAFAGMPQRVPEIIKTKPCFGINPKLYLYLPPYHYLDGVSFMTASGVSLHPAIAAVQTAPGRELYVLRDNGMQIGTDELGVANIWMAVLDCDEKGVPISL